MKSESSLPDASPRLRVEVHRLRRAALLLGAVLLVATASYMLSRQAWNLWFCVWHLSQAGTLALLASEPMLWLALGLLPLGVVAFVHVGRWRPRRPRTRWLPLLLLLGAAALPPLLSPGEESGGGATERINPWGFRSPFGLNADFVLPGDGRHIADQHITTNSFGFRDREWSLEKSEGRRRVLVVGDSFVWGFGIPDADGLLHSAIQRALDEQEPDRWEVFNIATSPAAMWYYAHATMAIARDARPDFVVVNFMGYFDIERYELARAFYEIPRELHKRFEKSPLARALMVMGTERSAAYSREGRLPGDLADEFRSQSRALLSFARDRQIPILVWSEFASARTLLDGALGDDFAVSHMSWCDVPLPPSLADPGRPANCFDGQRSAPGLTILGDGHPTPAANAVKGRAIAERLLAHAKPR